MHHAKYGKEKAFIRWWVNKEPSTLGWAGCENQRDERAACVCAHTHTHTLLRVGWATINETTQKCNGKKKEKQRKTKTEPCYQPVFPLPAPNTAIKIVNELWDIFFLLVQYKLQMIWEAFIYNLDLWLFCFAAEMLGYERKGSCVLVTNRKHANRKSFRYWSRKSDPRTSVYIHMRLHPKTEKQAPCLYITFLQYICAY